LNQMKQDSRDLAEESLRIIDSAKDKGTMLRLIGTCAIRLHSDTDLEVKDIDIVTYGKYVTSLRGFFGSLNYAQDRRIYALHGNERQIFHDPVRNTKIDIFVDKLRMCHTLDFRGRLELDYPTVTVSDLLLSKAQIAKLTDRDIKGIIALLLDHPLGEKDNETVNVEYITRLMSDDWGFCYTFNLNMQKIMRRMEESSVQDQVKRDVSQKIISLLSAIDKTPKTLKWRTRAVVGTKRKWYNEVDEVAR
jgi:hypothetical protein